MRLFSAQGVLSFVIGLVLAAPKDSRSEAHVYRTKNPAPGGQHGDFFDDKAIVLQNHKRIAYVTMYGCDPGQHITMIEVGYRDNHDPSTIIRDIVYHGGHSELGKTNLKLDRNEWFIQIRTSTWEHKITNPITWHTRTRIGNIEMFTNNGHSISCGAYLLSDPTVIDKPESNDGALLYFNGRSGDAIDMIQANWIPTPDF